MDPWLELFAQTAFRRSADTAHDLKTPLNVAVLNLELLRIRLAKLLETPDEKLTAYAASIEVELRRMAESLTPSFSSLHRRRTTSSRNWSTSPSSRRTAAEPHSSVGMKLELGRRTGCFSKALPAFWRRGEARRQVAA